MLFDMNKIRYDYSSCRASMIVVCAMCRKGHNSMKLKKDMPDTIETGIVIEEKGSHLQLDGKMDGITMSKTMEVKPYAEYCDEIDPDTGEKRKPIRVKVEVVLDGCVIKDLFPDAMKSIIIREQNKIRQMNPEELLKLDTHKVLYSERGQRGTKGAKSTGYHLGQLKKKIASGELTAEEAVKLITGK